MPVIVYNFPASSPCRAVRLTAAAIGIELQLTFTDLMVKEQFQPEFLEINPQHSVPTLDDDGFYLWESRAICTYLVDQYGKDDSLYPKDPSQRAVVDQRLYFDAGTLYQSFLDYYYPQIFAGAASDPAKCEKVEVAFEHLEKFLEGQDYVAGNNITVADLAIVASVSTFTVVDFNLNKYKNVVEWYARIKSEAPKYEEVNGEGLKALKELVDHLKNKHKEKPSDAKSRNEKFQALLEGWRKISNK